MNHFTVAALRTFDYIVTIIAAVVLPVSILSFFLFGPWSVTPLLILETHSFTVAFWSSAYLILVFARKYSVWRPFLFIFLWGLHEAISNVQYALANIPLDHFWFAYVATPLWFRYIFILTIASFASLFIIRSRLTSNKYWLLPLLALNILFWWLGSPEILNPLHQTIDHSLWPYEFTFNFFSLVIYLNLFKIRVLTKQSLKTHRFD